MTFFIFEVNFDVSKIKLMSSLRINYSFDILFYFLFSGAQSKARFWHSKFELHFFKSMFLMKNMSHPKSQSKTETKTEIIKIGEKAERVRLFLMI